jgi:hypothetical protein
MEREVKRSCAQAVDEAALAGLEGFVKPCACRQGALRPVLPPYAPMCDDNNASKKTGRWNGPSNRDCQLLRGERTKCLESIPPVTGTHVRP